jgi:hypothetical protein
MPFGRRFLLIAGLVIAVAFLGSCSDEDKILDSGESEEGDLNTWIWALDDETGTVWVHDADTGDLEATFSGNSHPMMRQALAGPDTEPTVWMGKGSSAYSFTRGFHPHGDHAHMELPEALGIIATGPSNVHQGVDDHGEYVCYANDGDSTFTLIHVGTRTASTIHHGSGHSAAFYSHGLLVATDMHSKWARVIDATADTVVHEAAIDTLAHGDAFHHDSETLFIATLNGFEVLSVEDGTLGTMVPYPTTGRVNFLYHAGDVPIAIGPHTAEGETDKVILLNMAAQTAEALTITGASLAWNISGGNFALSEDGKMVVASDLERAEAYVICIDVENATCYRTVLSVTVPAANMACAINYSGDHIWVLEKSTGTVSCYHPDEAELHNTWAADAAADYIFATSLAPGIEVIKDF